jgi:hypothetical protein
MAIGTVDYVSTAPWNDPFNPWPSTASVVVSGNGASGEGIPFSFVNVELPMTHFALPEVNGPAGQDIIIYGSGALKLYGIYNARSALYVWELGYYISSSDLFRLVSGSPVTKKDIPFILNANNLGTWYADDGSTTGLTIKPVYAVLTPWEYRRRRLLEYV